LVEDGYKRADFGRFESSLWFVFVNSFSGLRHKLMV